MTSYPVLVCFAEYWDTHLDRDAWLQQHLPPQLHSPCGSTTSVVLRTLLASWARGAVSYPSFQLTAFIQAKSAILIHYHRCDWE